MAKKNKTKKASNVADSGLVISDKAAGKVVFWSLSGDTNRDKLRTELTTAGLPEHALPSEETQPSLSLQNALAKLATGKRVRQERLTQRGAWAMVQSIVVVDEDAKEKKALGEATEDDPIIGEDVDHETTFRAWIERKADPNGGASNIILRVKGADDDTAESVRDGFQHQREHLATNAVGGWFKRFISEHCDGTNIRPSGGVWFVPEGGVANFDAMVAACAAAGAQHVFHTIPAVPSDDTVRCVLSAVNREASELLETVEAQIDTGDLGKRALTTKRRSLTSLSNKLKAYDDLLGNALADVRSRLDDCDATIGEAILLEEEAKSAQKVLAAAA